MTIKFDPILIENLRDQIMDNEKAQITVSKYAQECLDHFISSVNIMVEDQDVKDELFCQYQVQAWNKLFLLIAS